MLFVCENDIIKGGAYQVSVLVQYAVNTHQL